MNVVYVRSPEGKPLMPCRSVIARLLLKDGKAKVVVRTPFTIMLLEEWRFIHEAEDARGFLVLQV